MPNCTCQACGAYGGYVAGSVDPAQRSYSAGFTPLKTWTARSGEMLLPCAAYLPPVPPGTLGAGDLLSALALRVTDGSSSFLGILTTQGSTGFPVAAPPLPTSSSYLLAGSLLAAAAFNDGRWIDQVQLGVYNAGTAAESADFPELSVGILVVAKGSGTPLSATTP
jgi:hypothetical protein